jgi:hypothetical protein
MGLDFPRAGASARTRAGGNNARQPDRGRCTQLLGRCGEGLREDYMVAIGVARQSEVIGPEVVWLSVALAVAVYPISCAI